MIEKSYKFLKRIAGSKEDLEISNSLEFQLIQSIKVGTSIFGITLAAGVGLWNQTFSFVFVRAMLWGVIAFAVFLGTMLVGKYFARSSMKTKNKKFMIVLLFLLTLLIFLLPFIMVYVFGKK